jgi:hypothetical protein
MEKSLTTKCPRCNKLRPTEEVYEREDPWRAEVEDDHSLEEMCDECENDSADDI